MKFYVYTRRNGKHFRIHRDGCNQIAKNGGTGRGVEYHKFDTFKEAVDFGKLAPRDDPEEKWGCPFCSPGQYQ